MQCQLFWSTLKTKMKKKTNIWIIHLFYVTYRLAYTYTQNTAKIAFKFFWFLQFENSAHKILSINIKCLPNTTTHLPKNNATANGIYHASLYTATTIKMFPPWLVCPQWPYFFGNFDDFYGPRAIWQVTELCWFVHICKLDAINKSKIP